MDDGIATVAGSRGPSWSDATDWFLAWPFSNPFFSTGTTGALALLVTNFDKLLLALSLFALFERDRGIGFVCVAKGLATREVGFGVIAVPSPGVAGSANENSGAALEREVSVVLGGIFCKIATKATVKRQKILRKTRGFQKSNKKRKKSHSRN